MHTTIYLIRLEGKAVYVGFTSKTLEERWNGHCRKAKGKCNGVLQKAIRKYGMDVFTIETIYTSEDLEHTLNIMENQFIVEHNTHISKGGYNMTMGGEGSIGLTHSTETKRKISEANTGKVVSIETKINLSIAHKGNTHTTEAKRKISEYRKGKSHSNETKMKLKASALSRASRKLVSEETKRKISEAHKGKLHSDDHIRKMTEMRWKKKRLP